MINQISFRLPVERGIDLYAGVAEEIFSSANRFAVIQRQIFQEAVNFARQVRLFDSGDFYGAGNSAVEPLMNFPVVVEEMMQIRFVDVAAQEEDIFLFPVLYQPMQRLNIFVAQAVQIIAEKNDDVVLRDGNFFPK